jgi:Fic family protein
MVWNWQQPDWPAFAYDSARLAPLESRLLHESGFLFGAFAHLSDAEQRALTVELIGDEALMTLTRAGIAHLYFVTIHPFEDGNGRIARAIAEQVLAQGLGQPTLIALSHTIERHKKAYYSALERANKTNRIDDWLDYFAHTVLDALDSSRHGWSFSSARPSSTTACGDN